jgi:hypothetical protein
MSKKNQPEEEQPYTRPDFFRDLRKASRKLEPEERKPKRPSERSGEKS